MFDEKCIGCKDVPVSCQAFYIISLKNYINHILKQDGTQRMACPGRILPASAVQARMQYHMDSELYKFF